MSCGLFNFRLRFQLPLLRIGGWGIRQIAIFEERDTKSQIGLPEAFNLLQRAKFTLTEHHPTNANNLVLRSHRTATIRFGLAQEMSMAL